MESSRDTLLRAQLSQRRERLKRAISEIHDTTRLLRLLHEVESALERIDAGSYGICTVCNEPIEEEHLQWDPLVQVCLSHLSEDQQHAIERDLHLASQIQTTLLPARETRCNGWEVSYQYTPAGIVSGDYCDIVRSELDPGSFYFFLGDVSGKGVAASLLMSHLHAIFRSLVSSGISLDELTQRANRLFCESTMTSQYATLVSGRASASGEIALCNAGHCLPLVVHKNHITSVESTGLPVGLFCSGEYALKTVHLAVGDSLVLYTDGLTESRSPADVEYGQERLTTVITRHHASRPSKLVETITSDVSTFRAGMPQTDDLTIMVLNRTA